MKSLASLAFGCNLQLPAQLATRVIFYSILPQWWCKMWCIYTLSTCKASFFSCEQIGLLKPTSLALMNSSKRRDLFCKPTSVFIYLKLAILQCGHRVFNSGLLLFPHPSPAALPHRALYLQSTSPTDLTALTLAYRGMLLKEWLWFVFHCGSLACVWRCTVHLIKDPAGWLNAEIRSWNRFALEDSFPLGCSMTMLCSCGAADQKSSLFLFP